MNLEGPLEAQDKVTVQSVMQECVGGAISDDAEKAKAEAAIKQAIDDGLTEFRVHEDIGRGSDDSRLELEPGERVVAAWDGADSGTYAEVSMFYTLVAGKPKPAASDSGDYAI